MLFRSEITWEEMNERLGITNEDDKILECTTLTKLPRRIADFSKMNAEEAIVYNTPPSKKIYISINFVNYVDNSTKNVRGVKTPQQVALYHPQIADFLSKNLLSVSDKVYSDHEIDAKILFLGTGAETDDMIEIYNS